MNLHEYKEAKEALDKALQLQPKDAAIIKQLHVLAQKQRDALENEKNSSKNCI